MKQPEIKHELYTLRFPFAHVIFGRPFQMPCEVLFEYSENTAGEMRLVVKSITGKSENGTEYDLIYLTEDDTSEYAEFIVACIVSNKQFWNYNAENGEWWE